MKIILFLGSGVSFPTGLPDSKVITNSLLYDEWHSATDQNYYSGPERNPAFKTQNWILKLQPFIRLLKSYADAYYATRREDESNYEDLFYMAQQIYDEESGDIDNPIIENFIIDIKERISVLLNPESMVVDEITCQDLARRSCDFIQNVLWSKLYTNNTPEGMELIKELANSKNISKLDIFTLNHDLLVEKLLDKNQIKYLDGFDKPDGDIRYFNPSLFEKNEKIRLFKLHGSINWFRFIRKEDGNNKIDQYGIPIHPDHWHCKDANGGFVDDIEGKPRFLVGTHNKIISYAYGIYDEVHYWFKRLLSENNIIVMSGYGWNDKGINGKLWEWIFSSNKNKIFLLHKNPENEIKEKSKSAMWYRYDELVRIGKLVLVKKWLSEVTIDELFKIIKNTN